MKNWWWASMLLVTGMLQAADERPNVLIITVDDMNCDSVGAFGCALPDTTPHIDRLAAEGLRFEYAHVQVGNCMPSRNVLFSGRYPHNNRVEGFYQIRDPNYPVFADLMKRAGYFTGIRGKATHSTPFHPYPGWDVMLDEDESGTRQHIKDAESYYRSTKQGIAASLQAAKPFCLVVNVSDPHKPFYGIGKKNQPFDDPHVPSRVFSADEVPVPGFLFDDPVVRQELAHYYSSVRRADDCVGAVLRALDESGTAQQTLVMFLSDHGMPLPFAKTAVYHHSTHTPWIVRWPGKVRPQSVDKTHMISAVDFLPTMLEVIGEAPPEGLDGRSFSALLRGEEQAGRDYVVKVYNENSGGVRQPMRSIQDRRLGYIFNPWSDGKRTVRTATTGTATYRRMKALAASDPAIAARFQLFDFRVREELYDYSQDPDGLHNLIDDPNYADDLHRLRRQLARWMRETKDPLLSTFEAREQESVVQEYMRRVETESAERRKQKRSAAKGKDVVNWIRLRTPEQMVAGTRTSVTILHRFPAESEHVLTVTLKAGDSKRIERKVVRAKGSGRTKVDFQIPTEVTKQAVRIAAFVGEDYSSTPQHAQTEAIPVVQRP